MPQADDALNLVSPPVDRDVFSDDAALSKPSSAMRPKRIWAGCATWDGWPELADR